MHSVNLSELMDELNRAGIDITVPDLVFSGLSDQHRIYMPNNKSASPVPVPVLATNTPSKTQTPDIQSGMLSASLSSTVSDTTVSLSSSPVEVAVLCSTSPTAAASSSPLPDSFMAITSEMGLSPRRTSAEAELDADTEVRAAKFARYAGTFKSAAPPRPALSLSEALIDDAPL